MGHSRVSRCLVSMVLAWPLLATTSGVRAQTAGAGAADPASVGSSIFDVSVSAEAFNPSRAETVEIAYSLSKPADVTIRIFDPDFEEVELLLDAVERPGGPQVESWDGTNLDGLIVPDEAYFFTIEASDPVTGETVVYDPVTFSGGEPFDLSEARFDRESGTLSYRLSRMSRVLVRIGVPGSALLKTVVDWQPRVAGEITEYWNGKDESGLINVWEKNFSTLITYFTLPDNSIITYGNPEVDYREYKSSMAGRRIEKPERPMANARQLSPHFLRSRIADRSPEVRVTFPEHTDPTVSWPVVADRLLARIEVAKGDLEVLADQQYEIILFIDGVFFAEEERGYLPFNMPVELQQIPDGDHVLTVNLATFDGQIGVGSAKFVIQR